jgi:hypothetical protein
VGGKQAAQREHTVPREIVRQRKTGPFSPSRENVRCSGATPASASARFHERTISESEDIMRGRSAMDPSAERKGARACRTPFEEGRPASPFETQT